MPKRCCHCNGSHNWENEERKKSIKGCHIEVKNWMRGYALRFSLDVPKQTTHTATERMVVSTRLMPGTRSSYHARVENLSMTSINQSPGEDELPVL